VEHLPPDYDADPGRWRSWRAPSDVHDVVAPELAGPVLDVGCGEGRLAELAVRRGVTWVGVDASPRQLADNPHRPAVLADMRHLPFRDGAFREVTHLWCLYHVDDPGRAVAEAHRVLRRGGRYFASTSARSNDPELVPEGYPPTSFDAEEAPGIVASVFADVVAERWDEALVTLTTQEEVRAYCRHHFIPVEQADAVAVPLRLTKRGVLVRATKG
jgi:SAM-dependent methyltransferase